MRKQAIAWLGIALLGTAAAAVAAGHVKPVVDVQMECNTIVSAFEVDPVAARAALPAEYELALQPNGNALVYLQASNCTGLGNGEPLGSFDLADAWLAIDGPFEIDPVEGAAVTVPTMYVYVLKAQTTSNWVKTHCAAIQFPKELVRAIDVGGPIVPLRSGGVTEMTTRGYSWDEFFPCMVPPGSPWGECWMFPGLPDLLPVGFLLDPLPVGYNIRGYVKIGQGTEAMKSMSCVKHEAGQGLVELRLDPKSNLARLGIFQNPHVGLFSDSTAYCHLVMSQN